jgi:lipopolysaccharide transport system ATP-binding protein
MGVMELNHVSKKFRKGESFRSLSEAIPALLRRMLRGRNRDSLEEREFWALRDVSFKVEKGEVLGIIGHNGAGKSTLLKILSGVLVPTQGSVRVNGSISALIEIGAGFHPELTGRQNIYLNGTILGMTCREIARKFDQIVAFSGLEEFLDTPVKRYSTGMYARLGFSVAAHVDPEILIVDEVLSVGDYSFQNKCIERIKEIVKGGASVIFVSHNLNAVATLCTRGLLLDHGCVLKEGSAEDVIQAYLGKGRQLQGDDGAKEVFIERLVVRNREGPRVRLESGEDVWVDVDIKAKQRCEQLSLTVYLKSEQEALAFEGATERLGTPSFSLEAGESMRITMRLKMHLGKGTFHVGAHIYRYNIQKMYDTCYPATTLYIDSDRDIRGIANLYPEVVEAAISGPVVERHDNDLVAAAP